MQYGKLWAVPLFRIAFAVLEQYEGVPRPKLGWAVLCIGTTVVNVKLWLAADEWLSVTVKVNDDEPAAVGVPENVPAEKNNPGGRVVPWGSDQV
jgi:hypothetical protein